MKRLYSVIRNLHLLMGLFVSPFIAVFALSVFFLVHSWLPGSQGATSTRTISDVLIPADIERLKARELVDAVRPLLDRIGVEGEVGFIRQFPKERRFVMPVLLPGRETTVELNVPNRSATVTVRATGLADAMVYLHKMPGPHNVAIRGNSTHIKAWGWLADATVYLLFFITVSGVYLWAMLRAERRIGLMLLGAGAFSFFGLVYALIR